MGGGGGRLSIRPPGGCVSVLGWPSQTTTKWVLYFYGSGGQKSWIKVLVGPHPLPRRYGRRVLPPPQYLN